MEEQVLSYASPESDTLVIIVDASESAEKDWPAIVDLTKKVIQKTPAGIEKKLFFLSNSQEYNIQKFEENVGEWRKKNCKNGSFITPILSQISKARIVIIGSGIIYDLDDWALNQISQQMTFLKLSESMRGDLDIGTEIEKDMFDGVVANAQNSILSMSIYGSDFMPYYWDNPGYSVSPENNYSLKASKLENYSINMAAFGKTIKSSVETTEGCSEISLIKNESLKPDIVHLIEQYAVKWKKLEKDEAVIFKNHIRSEKVICPVSNCKKEITGALRCDNQVIHGRLLGWPIYKSLNNLKGFVFFKDCQEGVYYKPYPSEIIKIGEMAVALNKKSKAVVLRYDPITHSWMEYEDLKPYYPLKEGYYVSTV